MPELVQKMISLLRIPAKVLPGDSLPMPNEVPMRKNFDQHLNDHGKILLEICKSLDIRILNGRCKGDSFGKITFHGQHGNKE